MPPAQSKKQQRIVTFSVNGHMRKTANSPADRPLLSVLRDEMGLTGTRFGCGEGSCGACTVLLDGRPVRACITPVSALQGRAVTTIEGIGTPEQPHPVQAAFITEQAAQCGFCTPGMVMETVAFLEANPAPETEAIKSGLNGHLCRCGSHQRILRAVKRAAEGRT